MNITVEVVSAGPESLQRAGRLIREGLVVSFPTETLYGLAADALSPRALERLLALKRRDRSQPIPLLVADRQMLSRVVARIPAAAEPLMRRHWPGPLTLVLPALDGLPGPLLGPAGGVGVRISSDPVAAALVREAGRPLTATSANISQGMAAATAGAAALEGVALVLDDGPRDQPPSTVVEVLDRPRVLRQGAIRL
jgi:L-threonylcarbamoyladenylate synthase